MNRAQICTVSLAGAGLLLSASALADPYSFTTGDPDFKMATASRPESSGKIEIESADDFPITTETLIDSATFTGLIVPTTSATPTIGEVRVEIYRVFPLDSNTTRTPVVPTRTNSPADVEFADRDTATGNLTFTTTPVGSGSTAANSVLNGIRTSAPFATDGEGEVSGQEVQFKVTFTTPFDLPANSPFDYFFVPQVEVTGGEFYWLSAPRPIMAPGTAFPMGVTDLQEWIRNENLAPDWLRVGTDIVDGASPPTFNATFSVGGETVVSEPASLSLLGMALTGIGLLGLRQARPG